ncbi:VTT domain-containing protein [Methylotenera versatilis]|nr:VTT domain-containing protein [Methylotenera versatilis]
MQIWQMILNFDAHLPQLVAAHANMVYWILFAVIFLQIGVLPLFFLPGNPFLFVCGAVWAASQLNISLLLIVLIVAAVLGNLCAYGLGKTIGQLFFLDYLKWPKQATLDKTRNFYDKHGEKSFLICLFLPVIRTLAPFLAGVTQMVFIKFARASSIGAVFWVLTCVLLGYFFGNIPIIKQHLGTFTMVGLGIVIIVVLLKKSWQYFAKTP